MRNVFFGFRLLSIKSKLPVWTPHCSACSRVLSSCPYCRAALVSKAPVTLNPRSCRTWWRASGLSWKVSSTRGTMILSGEKIMFLPVLGSGSCLYRFKANFWLLKKDRAHWIAGIRDTFEVTVGGISGSQEQGISPGRSSQRSRMESAILD